MPIVTPCVLVELNGADPVHVIRNLPAIRVHVLDWEDVRAGEVSTADLIEFHDLAEDHSPNTARSIRDVLRERGMSLPDYESDFVA
jgi:hypothetical protein